MYNPNQDGPTQDDWFAKNDPSKKAATSPTGVTGNTTLPPGAPAQRPGYPSLTNQPPPGTVIPTPAPGSYVPGITGTPGFANTGQWGGGWDQSFATPLSRALQLEIANGKTGQAAIDAISKDFPDLATQAGQIQFYPDKGQYGLPGNMYVAPNAAKGGVLDLIQRGGADGGAGSGALTAPFTEPFNAPTPIDLGGPGGLPQVPTFTPPDFHAPTAASVLQDPGYQFRLGQGEQALQQSAAGQGLLNTGGTLKNVLDYGQNFASNEFQNAWNRNMDVYNTAFQSAAAAFAPKMTGYQTEANLIPGINQNNYQNAYNKWLQDYNIFRNQKLDTFNEQFQTATS